MSTESPLLERPRTTQGLGDFGEPATPETENPRTNSPASIQFEHDVRSMLRASATDKAKLRSLVIERIRQSDSPSALIRLLLRVAISSRRAGRLDDAIDVLSQVDQSLTRFAADDFLRENHPGAEDDYWYVVLRALGKSRLSKAHELVEIFWRFCPEAAAEALGEINSESSMEKLKLLVADEGVNGDVRALAREIIEESHTR